MRYETFAPPPDLADHVEHFWMVEAPAHAAPHREILIPNGRPTVLLCLGQPGRRVAIQGGKVETNTSNCAGLLRQPIILEQEGVSRYLAAQLRPWGLSAFGLPSLVDTTLPLGAWLGAEELRELEVLCSAQGFGADAARPLQALLSARLLGISARKLAPLQAALRIIESQKGMLSVDALSASLGVGYHTLYRLFRDHIGVSVKQFLSIIRFYHFAGELLQGGFGSLSLLANLQGYYDQAHATREFKRFTGISQTEFRRHLNGIAKLMHGRD